MPTNQYLFCMKFTQKEKKNKKNIRIVKKKKSLCRRLEQKKHGRLFSRTRYNSVRHSFAITFFRGITSKLSNI